MKKVPLSEVKDQLSEYLHLAEEEEIIITRHGKPAGILKGFASEDDWFDRSSSKIKGDATLYLRRLLRNSSQ